jgi:transposase-like protein
MMTEYELKVPGQLLSSLMNDKNALAELLEKILNQVLEVQAEDQLGAGLKRIFAAETAAEARQRCAELAAQMEGPAAKAIRCLESGLEDALAVMALPAKYRRRMKSTNMQERLIQEVRRRIAVVDPLQSQNPE